MIYQKKTINNVPTKIPLSTSVPTGNPIGTIISTYKKIQPRNYLYCDGSTFDETIYPALYLYLGTNVLPDYRECAIVGAEQNTTDTIATHDVYTEGEFKDDQFQSHDHTIQKAGSDAIYTAGTGSGNYAGFAASSGTASNVLYAVQNSGRKGDVTRGKRKAVYYYIKAVDGVDISDEDTFLNTVKNYVDENYVRKIGPTSTSSTKIDNFPSTVSDVQLEEGWYYATNLDTTSIANGSLFDENGRPIDSFYGPTGVFSGFRVYLLAGTYRYKGTNAALYKLEI